MDNEKRFKFTLLAATYIAQGINVKKPFFVVLPEGDPRIELFRCAAFKEESVDASGVKMAPPNPLAVDLRLPGDDAGFDEAELDETPIGDIEGETIKEATVDLLRDAGFEHVEDILDKGDGAFAALVEINGIGEATAEKILDACEKAIAENEE